MLNVKGKSTMKRLLALCLATICLSVTAGQGAPQHLLDVEQLVSKLDLSRTNYEHGQGSIEWQSPVSVHTDCSGLVDHLLMHSYGYTPESFKRWFDSTRPSARRYFDAIQSGRGFVNVATVKDLLPGDFIAVKYLARTENTGHIMIVDGLPERIAGTPPLVTGTDQWTVSVIDSSESGHGKTDSRHKQGVGGRDHDGLGKGILRLYSDKQGAVTGFSWSTLKSSEFKSPDSEPIALGRLIGNYRP
jgi:hypothetical protein